MQMGFLVIDYSEVCLDLLGLSLARHLSFFFLSYIKKKKIKKKLRISVLWSTWGKTFELSSISSQGSN